MTRRALQLGILVLIAGGFTGCASSRVDQASATRGLEIELLKRGGESEVAYYVVTPDGKISFGGGTDALLEKTTWTGALTTEEIDDLWDLIRQAGWFEEKPESEGEPPPTYEIQLRGPQGNRHYRVKGESDAIEPVVELLDEISRRRFEEYLRTFPKPGEQDR